MRAVADLAAAYPGLVVVPPGRTEAEVVAALAANQGRVSARRALAGAAAQGDRRSRARLMLAAGMAPAEVARLDSEAWQDEVRQGWRAGLAGAEAH